MAASAKLSEEINLLLEHYLLLLDQYTELRSQLSVAQSAIHENIARANFTADRGIRYGEELYDARMQASRFCRITVPTHVEGPLEHGTTASTTAFKLSMFAPHEEVEQTSDGTQQEVANGAKSPGAESLKIEDLGLEEKTPVENLGKKTSNDEDTDDIKRTDSEKMKKTPNPLRMFGILTPSSLRLAQATSIKAVSALIPAILSLDSQMKEIEIQIRRARKHKLKAERQDANGELTMHSFSKEDEGMQTLLNGKIETAIV